MRLPAPAGCFLLAAGLLAAGCASRVDLKQSVQVTDVSTGWFDAGIVDGILCDPGDPASGTTIDGITVVATDTLMRDDAGQQRLARESLAFAASLRSAA